MSSPTNKALECFCGAMTIRWPCAGMETWLNKVAPAASRRWRSGSSCYVYQHWIITINISPHARICRQVPGLQIKFVDLINLMSRPRHGSAAARGRGGLISPIYFPPSTSHSCGAVLGCVCPIAHVPLDTCIWATGTGSYLSPAINW